MSVEESKEKLQKEGYCTFDLKDYNFEYYKLFEKIKYKKSDEKYLESFKSIKFDYHNVDNNIHIGIQQKEDTFEKANIKKEELLKKYDYKNTEQIWFSSEITPNDELNGISFRDVFYDILKYFYNETENELSISMQWTCYSENCFLKDHRDGQGQTYQNTCAILIYLNEEWNENWGGNLILNKKNKIIPLFGKVAIIDLKTFDISHAVEKVMDKHNRFALITFATSKTPKNID